MNWHDIIDERSYEMHKVISRELRNDPKKLDVVLRQMDQRLGDPDYSESLKQCVREWREIVVAGVDRVLEVLADRSEEGNRLRQNSPFAIIMPKEERLEILRRYNYETIRARTHSSSV